MIRESGVVANTALVIGALFFSFLCFEIGIRIFYGNPHVFHSPQVRHIPTHYGYKPEPNQQSSYTLDKPVATNSSGFRDHKQWTELKTAGVTRIMIVGDSFTFGNGVRAEEMFSNILEKKLKLSNKNVEVLNASAIGWNLDNESAFFLTEGITYEPDILILAFFPNDWISPPAPGAPDVLPMLLTPEGRIDSRPSWLKWLPYEIIYKLKYSAAIMYLRDRLAVLDSLRIGQDIVTLLLRNKVDLDGSPTIKYSYEKIVEMKHTCDWYSIPLVIAAIPPVNLFWISEGKPLYLDHLRHFAENNKIDFLDLSDALRPTGNRTLFYNYPWDNHLNPEGHRRVANVLHGFISELLLRRQSILHAPPAL